MITGTSSPMKSMQKALEYSWRLIRRDNLKGDGYSRKPSGRVFSRKRSGKVKVEKKLNYLRVAVWGYLVFAVLSIGIAGMLYETISDACYIILIHLPLFVLIVGFLLTVPYQILKSIWQAYFPAKPEINYAVKKLKLKMKRRK